MFLLCFRGPLTTLRPVIGMLSLAEFAVMVMMMMIIMMMM